MGVVPQFDILWDDMTAAEHMRMFCKIKGVKNEDIALVTKEKLFEVNLADVANAQVKTFSGGMKRRLSVAISGIGNPKIIFMDEPTTGMDPVSRRQVWQLIQKLKKNKVMILTTHAMEEADVLSDRIAVVVDGVFKCVGTPLYLKNTFGDGYRITMVAKQDKEERVKELMQRTVPTARTIDESAGSLVYSVPITNISDISPIFK
jgi:ABC-type multidrug transport system ATPase subunit